MIKENGEALQTLDDQPLELATQTETEREKLQLPIQEDKAFMKFIGMGLD